MLIILASRIPFIANDGNSLLPLPIRTNSKQAFAFIPFYCVNILRLFSIFTVEIQSRRFSTQLKKSKLGKHCDYVYSFGYGECKTCTWTVSMGWFFYGKHKCRWIMLLFNNNISILPYTIGH